MPEVQARTTIFRALVLLAAVFAMPEVQAQTTDAASSEAGADITLLLLLATAVMVWMLLGGPQRKREKQLQSIIESLQEGDEIITHSGIVGTISSLAGEFAIVEISKGVSITIRKAAVANLLPKGTARAL